MSSDKTTADANVGPHSAKWPESPGRRRALGMVAGSAVLAAIGAGATPAAIAQPGTFPSRPVRIIVPHTPGGLVDTFVRYLGDELQSRWKQPVVIDNKPGANQIIGAEAAAAAPPDGYTLFVGTQTGLVFNAVLKKQLRFDPVKDFAPITVLFNTPFYLVVNPKLPVNNVSDLVALAKAKPGVLTYASIGQGSSQQLATEMFKTMAGVNILHVPYKGSGPAMNDLLGGQVDMMFEGGGSSLPNVRAGRLKALASTGATRADAMPDLPTLGETVKGYELAVWIGLMAPGKTPPEIVDRINKDVTAVLRKPETQKKFTEFDITVAPTTPQELGRMVSSEIPEWTKVITAAGIERE